MAAPPPRIPPPPFHIRSSNTFHFRLHLHATQVPRYICDRLLVSFMPLDSQRISSQTTNVEVRHSACHWTEPIVESTTIAQDPKTKEYEHKMAKLIVSQGSSHDADVLGEATINLTEFIYYTSSPARISLPLENCRTGTILHMTILRLLQNTDRSRDPELQRKMSYDQEHPVSMSDDNDSNSDKAESLASQPMNLASMMKLSSRQTKDAVARGYSSDTLELPELPSHVSYGNRDHLSGRYFSPPASATSSLHLHESFTGQIGDSDSNRTPSHHISQNQQVAEKHQRSKSWHDATARKPPQPTATPTRRLSSRGVASEGGSFYDKRTDMAAAELTIQELREAAMAWERQARKLQLEAETSKQQLNSEMKQGSELKMELSTLKVECDNLRMEVAQLNMSKLALEEREYGNDSARWEAEDAKHSLEVLQEEIMDEKEANLNLTSQLQKTQESYSELLSAVSEMEETLEQQSLEIERLTEVNNELAASLAMKEEKCLFDDSEDEDEIQQPWGNTQHICIEKELIKKLADKDEELTDLKERYADLQFEMGEMVLNAETMRKQLHAGNTACTHIIRGSREKNVQELEHLTLPSAPPISDAEESNSETRDEFLKTIEMHKQQINELNEDCNDLRQKNIDLVYRLNTANKELEVKTRCIVFLEERIRVLGSSDIQSGSLSNELRRPASLSILAPNKVLAKSMTELHWDKVSLDRAIFDQLREKNKRLTKDISGEVAHTTPVVGESTPVTVEKQTDKLSQIKDIQTYHPPLVGTFQHAFSGRTQDLSIQERLEPFLQESIHQCPDSSQTEHVLDQPVNEIPHLELPNGTLAKITPELGSPRQNPEHLTEREANSVIKKLETELENKKVEIMTEKQLRKGIQQRLQSAQDMMAMLETGKENDKTKIQELESRLSEGNRISTSQIGELEQQLCTLAEDIQKLRISREEAQHEATNLTIEKTSLEKKLQEFEKESSDVTRKLEGQVAILNMTLDSHATQNQVLERKLQEVEAHKEQLEMQVTALHAETMAFRQTIQSLEMQLKHVMDKNETYEKERATYLQIQDEKDKVQCLFERAICEHQQELSKLQKNLKSSLEEVNHLRQARTRLIEELDQLNNEVCSLNLSKRKLESLIVDLQISLSFVKNEVQDVKDENTLLAGQVALLKSQGGSFRNDDYEQEIKRPAGIDWLTELQEDSSKAGKILEESMGLIDTPTETPPPLNEE